MGLIDYLGRALTHTGVKVGLPAAVCAGVAGYFLRGRNVYSHHLISRHTTEFKCAEIAAVPLMAGNLVDWIVYKCTRQKMISKLAGLTAIYFTAQSQYLGKRFSNLEVGTLIVIGALGSMVLQNLIEDEKKSYRKR